ncbi:hypothetical protein HMPREF3102_02000 [Micrococcus sp. HMSC30C05]|nr:hypothetical protein HMPREF3102_02000 [Micrococcus sp. HMSC30C05]
MMMNFSAFHTSTSTTRCSRPGPPPSIRTRRTLAAYRYGMASSTAGTPHFSPRRVRIAFRAMLVGM